jgi:DNA repair exonuclease SbcCD nuclease subunit
MSVTFIHTADWQLGKPFGSVEDVQKRSLLQQERLRVLERIARAAHEAGADFVLVAGDMFDSAQATKATVAAACTAIGAMKMPVLVIPGNHDHGGPGSVWEQSFFKQEQAQRAPNLRVLLTAELVELGSAVILPCPLLHRQDMSDPTGWLRTAQEALDSVSPAKPRIVLAHGTIQGFGSQADEEELCRPSNANFIDLARLPSDRVDYIALGDWHGTKQLGAKAWYAGTPEMDRFPRGESNIPGNILKVTVSRGGEPAVTPIRTAHIQWQQKTFDFVDDASLTQLDEQVEALLSGRVSSDLLELELRGSLGIEATNRLGQMLDSWRARLLRLKLRDETVLAPSEDEIVQLSQQVHDPLIARVATKLIDRCRETGEQAAVARVALRELHAMCAAL